MGTTTHRRRLSGCSPDTGTKLPTKALPQRMPQASGSTGATAGWCVSVLIKAKNTSGEIILVPGIMPITAAMLCRALGHSAHWEKVNAKGEPVHIDPPDKVVEQIMGMIDEWPFPPLAGVITCPTLRPDGTLLANEGYDNATGLVLYNPIPIPEIPRLPTRDDALRAIAVLDSLLTEFPFVDRASLAVALSEMLTVVLRGAFAIAPLHLTNAPEAGTGKSYLADLVSAIATGERCAVISVAPNPEETEKRLVGAALAGYPIIALDNVRELLQGDFLCQVTERPLLQLRRLGSSDQIRLANTVCCFANGNNATVADDLVRRTITCTLDANMESPETRTFKSNPFADVIEKRGKYIAACLTVARAYTAAGNPDCLPPLPSYEGWSHLVRSSLVWLGNREVIRPVGADRFPRPPIQFPAEVIGESPTARALRGWGAPCCGRDMGQRVLAERPRMQLVSCNPVRRGIATIMLPRGLKLVGCAVLYSGCRTWTPLPSRPQIYKEGRHKTDANGQLAYGSVTERCVRALADRFSSAMVHFAPREHGAELDRGS
jgi:hypothetical protein